MRRTEQHEQSELQGSRGLTATQRGSLLPSCGKGRNATFNEEHQKHLRLKNESSCKTETQMLQRKKQTKTTESYVCSLTSTPRQCFIYIYIKCCIVLIYIDFPRLKRLNKTGTGNNKSIETEENNTIKWTFSIFKSCPKVYKCVT